MLNWEWKNLCFDYNEIFQPILIIINIDIETDMGVDRIDEETTQWLAETLGWWKV
jgi:hypothetical protein